MLIYLAQRQVDLKAVFHENYRQNRVQYRIDCGKHFSEK